MSFVPIDEPLVPAPVLVPLAPVVPEPVVPLPVIPEPVVPLPVIPEPVVPLLEPVVPEPVVPVVPVPLVPVDPVLVVPVAAGRVVPVVAALVPDVDELPVMPDWLDCVGVPWVLLPDCDGDVPVPVCASARPPAMARPTAVAMIVFLLI